MSSYAEMYDEPVLRVSKNGKSYSVEPLVQRDLRPWVSELRAKKINVDIADIPPMKPEERAKLIQKIRAVEFTPNNLRYLVAETVDGVIRVLELSGEKLGLKDSDLTDFVDGKSSVQNEKDAFRISGLFLADDYLARFRDETPGWVHQLFDAAMKGSEEELIRIAKAAATEAKENKRLADEAKAKKEAGEADPNASSPT